MGNNKKTIITILGNDIYLKNNRKDVAIFF